MSSESQLGLFESAPALETNLPGAPGRHQTVDATDQSRAAELNGDALASELEIPVEVLQLLAEPIKQSDVDELERDELAQAAFELDVEEKPLETEQRELVFTRFRILCAAYVAARRRGFPVRRLELYECMQELNALAATSDDALLTSTLGYEVADTYHPHRMDVQIAKRPTPRMAFNRDAYLAHALKLCYFQNKDGINERRLLSVLQLVRGAQAAANFRPGFALRMYRQYAAGGTVLDTSMGFGGRICGFIASPAVHYVGIDPATQTFEANVRLLNDLCDTERQSWTLINEPAEDVDADAWGIRETCDFAFTSPPYFSKEHYSDEPTQSWKRYGEIRAWVEGFLEPMMRLQFAALKAGATSRVNIAPVTIDGKEHPLDEYTRLAGIAAGFHFAATERFTLSRGYGQGVKKEAFEPMLVFRKP